MSLILNIGEPESSSSEPVSSESSPPSATVGGITLWEADQSLFQAALHATDQEHPPSKRLRAIRDSGEELLRRTGISRGVSAITLPEGVTHVDVADLVPDFLSGHLYAIPHLSAPENAAFRELASCSFNNLRAAYRRSITSGVPEMISWATPTRVYVYPVPDKDYTLELPWTQPLTAFDPEQAYTEQEMRDILLNIPRQHAGNWIRWGARAFLLLGAEGHDREATRAMAEFEKFIEQVMGEVHDHGVWYADRDTGRDNAWRPQGFL